jgi:hypothetical protein
MSDPDKNYTTPREKIMNKNNDLGGKVLAGWLLVTVLACLPAGLAAQDS